MFYRVRSVNPLPNFVLAIAFENGEHKRYDIKPLFHKWECFKSLEQIKGLYEQAKVDSSGYGISWNDDIDLSCNELYSNGTVDVAAPNEVSS